MNSSEKWFTAIAVAAVLFVVVGAHAVQLSSNVYGHAQSSESDPKPIVTSISPELMALVYPGSRGALTDAISRSAVELSMVTAGNINSLAQISEGDREKLKERARAIWPQIYPDEANKLDEAAAGGDTEKLRSVLLELYASHWNERLDEWYNLTANQSQCIKSSWSPAKRIEEIRGGGIEPNTRDYKDSGGHLYKVEVSYATSAFSSRVFTYWKGEDACLSDLKTAASIPKEYQ